MNEEVDQINSALKVCQETLTDAMRYNHKLRCEIRSLHRKLVDANRGAERNAIAMHITSLKGVKDAEDAYRLRKALGRMITAMETKGPGTAEYADAVIGAKLELST